MGGTLSVAVFLSILFSTVGNKIGAALRVLVPTPQFQAALADPAVRSNPVNKAVVQIIQSGAGGSGGNAGGVLQDSTFLQHIDPRLARPFLVGFSDAMDLAFLLVAGTMIVAFVLSLRLKEVPLRHQSGPAGPRRRTRRRNRRQPGATRPPATMKVTRCLVSRR